MREIFIDIEGDKLDPRYVVGVVENNTTFWVREDLALTRVRENRAFTRDYNKATKIVDLLWCRRLREGLPYGLFA